MEFERIHREKTTLERLQAFRLGDIQQGPRDRDRTETILTSSPVFVVGDSFYRSRIPKSTHWSIAWSDLMMTMFILFLSLFVYQVAHREFINEDAVEVVSGASIDVPVPSSSLPIIPIAPEISSQRGDALKRTEVVQVARNPEKTVPAADRISVTVHGSTTTSARDGHPTVPPLQQNSRKKTDESMNSAAQTQDPHPTSNHNAQPEEATASSATPDDGIEPPAITQLPQPAMELGDQGEIITELYDLSRYTLQSEKLEKFASVELIPDKAVRIILTGDLLFASGKAELTDEAKNSLSKLTEIIKKTPYIVNVNGHTDNIPIHSDRFPSNWELSVARASRVARFLIEETGLPGSRFRVSGFSFFRPVKPNTSSRNRAANRRVEIIISKEPAMAQMKPM